MNETFRDIAAATSGAKPPGSGAQQLQQQMNRINEFEAPGSVAPMIVYALLGFIAFSTICLHRFIPQKLWSRFDIFSMEHSTKEGNSVVKRRTQLGFAFTVAFLPVAAMVIVGLSVSNRPNETPSLQASNWMPATAGLVSVTITLPLESHMPVAAVQQSTSSDAVGVCPNVTMVNGGATGLTCDQEMVFDQATCTFTGVGCRLGLSTTFTFSVPWNQRWVQVSLRSLL